MASRLRIVATAVGGNIKVFNESSGVLIPRSNPQLLAEALTRYVHDRGLRMQHGKASRKRAVTAFSMDVMVNSYVRVYDSLLRTAA